MTVYVDHYRATFRRLRLSHMIADTEEELDAMADRLGLKRTWKQTRKWIHYDICESNRRLAIRYGAISVTSRELILELQKGKQDGVE